MALYSFRDSSYMRKSRLQLIEEGFIFGMQYTNTPLLEGYNKTMVNLDLHDAGVSLTPRAGLRTSAFYTPSANILTPCTGLEQMLQAGERYIDDAVFSQFMVLKEMTATKIGKLYKGNIAMITDSGASITGMYPVPQKSYLQEIYPTAAYIVPDNAEIHGIALDNSLTLARHVGTKAWAQRYYFFDPITHEVVYTKFDEDTSKFVFTTEPAKQTNINTAVTWGYNMLMEDPYTFVNTFSAGGGIIDFDGILPYNVNGTLNLTPVTNESLSFRLYYKVPQGKKYHIVWEWRSVSADTWTTIREYDVTFDTLLEQAVPFTAPDAGIIMRVSGYGYTQNEALAWVRNTFVDATLAVGFNFDKNAYGNTTNMGNTNYTIDQASGMAYWKNRVVVWGVPEDPNILFASDINDPTYFPYPNNVEIFDEPVKYAVPFLDNLLVFTSSKLYILTLSMDGLGWTTKCIQNNLSIADWDIHLIQVVKNMVFFRSGNYYYMIVPKSGSLTGELTLAAVAKPLYYFFDNFEESVKEIVNSAYDYQGSLTLVHYYNYLDFEDVHNVYVFKTDNDEYLNFCLLYSTATRSWRIYCYGSQSIRIPFKADATQRGTICSLGSISDGTGGTKAAPQLFMFDNTNRADWYIPRGVTPETMATIFTAVHYFKNWQHLDTGYREHSSNFKKRYRELQFVLNNLSNRALNFYTDFYIDGEQRKNRYTYEVMQEKDPESPNYGLITVEKKLAEPMTAPATTALGASDTDYSAWRLDTSMFPDVSFWKVRLPVSGKGYTPRFCLTSRNEEAYELLNISYVYRAMGSR